MKKRSCYLSVDAYTRLELVMTGFSAALNATPYLVGSCLTTPDFRDVDVRVILDDDAMEAKFSSYAEQRVVQSAVSQYLSAATGVLIDFQWQSRTEHRTFPTDTPVRPLGLALPHQAEEQHA